MRCPLKFGDFGFYQQVDVLQCGVSTLAVNFPFAHYLAK